MRVLPVNNFVVSTKLKKNNRLEKPTTTSQESDTVSFKSAYRSAYQEGLRKFLDTRTDALKLFNSLIESFNPEYLYNKVHYLFDKNYKLIDFVENSYIEEDVVVERGSGKVLMDVAQGSVNFRDPDRKCSPISFWCQDDDLFVKRPGNEFNYEDDCWAIYRFRPCITIKDDYYKRRYGTIKEYQEVCPSGIVKQIYYDKYGREDGLKNFFFGK
ncbi:hypothetical protein IJ384_03590 [bacterium]|nr:hypothetical protein [bacterium]